MLLRLNDDELAIDEVFGGFFTSECGPEVVRESVPLGFSPGLWQKLAQTGAPSMAAPETLDGGGADLSALALVVQHLGRTLAPVPLIEHAVATRLLAATNPDFEHLPALIEGTKIATLALHPDNVDQLVAAGAVADVVVSLRNETLQVHTGNAPMAAPTNMADLPVARRSLDDSTELAGGRTEFTIAVAEWQVLMAAALVGLGQGALQLGVDYVKERYQFGVLIGTFQAVQHGLANSSTGVEGADLLAKRAAWALDSGQPNGGTLASMSLLFAAESAQLAAANSLQFHGGYGFAEEYDVQLYYRRAKGWPMQHGASGTEYQRLADQLLPATTTTGGAA